MLSFFNHAQRSLDLELTISSPADGATIEIEQLYNLIVNVKNVDASEQLQAADSVYYYLLLWGDTMLFAPGNTNYLSYTNNALQPGQNFAIARQSAFSSQFEGMDVELCVSVKPVNQANPVDDPDLTNNGDCITVHVVGHDLTVSESALPELSLYPNPASDEFLLKGLQGDEQLSVWNAQGEKLESRLTASGTMDCSDWPNGVYFLTISGQHQNTVKKLIISH